MAEVNKMGKALKELVQSTFDEILVHAGLSLLSKSDDKTGGQQGPRRMLELMIFELPEEKRVDLFEWVKKLTEGQKKRIESCANEDIKRMLSGDETQRDAFLSAIEQRKTGPEKAGHWIAEKIIKASQVSPEDPEIQAEIKAWEDWAKSE